MIDIEVIGLDPPCEKCAELLENTRSAVKQVGFDARVEKRWTLDPKILKKYGLLLSPALVIDGVVLAQGKVFKTDRIVELLTD